MSYDGQYNYFLPHGIADDDNDNDSTVDHHTADISHLINNISPDQHYHYDNTTNLQTHSYSHHLGNSILPHNASTSQYHNTSLQQSNDHIHVNRYGTIGINTATGSNTSELFSPNNRTSMHSFLRSAAPAFVPSDNTINTPSSNNHDTIYTPPSTAIDTNPISTSVSDINMKISPVSPSLDHNNHDSNHINSGVYTPSTSPTHDNYYQHHINNNTTDNHSNHTKHNFSAYSITPIAHNNTWSRANANRTVSQIVSASSNVHSNTEPIHNVQATGPKQVWPKLHSIKPHPVNLSSTDTLHINNPASTTIDTRNRSSSFSSGLSSPTNSIGHSYSKSAHPRNNTKQRSTTIDDSKPSKQALAIRILSSTGSYSSDDTKSTESNISVHDNKQLKHKKRSSPPMQLPTAVPITELIDTSHTFQALSVPDDNHTPTTDTSNDINDNDTTDNDNKFVQSKRINKSKHKKHSRSNVHQSNTDSVDDVIDSFTSIVQPVKQVDIIGTVNTALINTAYAVRTISKQAPLQHAKLLIQLCQKYTMILLTILFTHLYHVLAQLVQLCFNVHQSSYHTLKSDQHLLFCLCGIYIEPLIVSSQLSYYIPIWFPTITYYASLATFFCIDGYKPIVYLSRVLIPIFMLTSDWRYHSSLYYMNGGTRIVLGLLCGSFRRMTAVQHNNLLYNPRYTISPIFPSYIMTIALALPVAVYSGHDSAVQWCLVVLCTMYLSPYNNKQRFIHNDDANSNKNDWSNKLSKLLSINKSSDHDDSNNDSSTNTTLRRRGKNVLGNGVRRTTRASR